MALSIIMWQLQCKGVMLITGTLLHSDLVVPVLSSVKGQIVISDLAFTCGYISSRHLKQLHIHLSFVLPCCIEERAFAS